MKKYIPNILTTYRLLVSLLMPMLLFTNYFKVLFVMFLFAILSDTFDGYLARKWNVVSTYGKVVDAISDKLLAISTTAIFVTNSTDLFIITFSLEMIIALINIYKWIKYKGEITTMNSSIYGKIKTWLLFTLLCVGFISIKYSYFDKCILSLIIITMILQLFTIFNYIKEEKIRINS